MDIFNNSEPRTDLRASPLWEPDGYAPVTTVHLEGRTGEHLPFARYLPGAGWTLCAMPLAEVPNGLIRWTYGKPYWGGDMRPAPEPDSFACCRVIVPDHSPASDAQATSWALAALRAFHTAQLH